MKETKELMTYHDNGMLYQIPLEMIGDELFVNAKAMAKPFGKRPVDWLRLPSAKEFIQAVSEVRSMYTVDSLIVTRSGGLGGGGGTWLHKELAIEFARWLSPKFAIWCNDRITEYMKFGIVATDNTIEGMINNPDFGIKLLLQLKQEREEKELIVERNKKLEYRDKFVRTIADTDYLLEMSKVSKILQLKMGRNGLFKYLREEGIFFQNRNEPQQEYVNRGYFKVKVKVVAMGDRRVPISQTFASVKGVMFIYKYLNKNLPEATNVQKENIINLLIEK